MGRFGISLVALAALSGCAAEPSATGAFANRAAVQNPAALFDVAPRSDVLRANNGRTGEPRGAAVCPRATDLVDLAPLTQASLAVLRGNPDSTQAPREFARALNVSAYRLLIDLDMQRAGRDVAVLRAHADSNAWLGAEAKGSSTGAVIDGMGPLLPAWQILRQSAAASADDRRAIDGWLTRLAAFAQSTPKENSSATFRGANAMLLGLMTGNETMYRQGSSGGFYAQLGTMRADGSFPMEVDRGLSALDNQSRNIGLLVYSARIAESRGVDLWGAQVNGRGIDEAIGFLLRAADDNALVDVYAQANRNPSKDHPVFRPGAQIDPFKSSATRGWIKLYAARWPGTPLSEELTSRVAPSRRLSNDIVGGYVTCYDGRV
jgi:Alginate lyase